MYVIGHMGIVARAKNYVIHIIWNGFIISNRG